MSTSSIPLTWSLIFPFILFLFYYSLDFLSSFYCRLNLSFYVFFLIIVSFFSFFVLLHSPRRPIVQKDEKIYFPKFIEIFKCSNSTRNLIIIFFRSYVYVCNVRVYVKYTIRYRRNRYWDKSRWSWQRSYHV